MRPVLIYVLVSSVLLAACVPSEGQVSPPVTTIETLANDLQSLGVKPQFVALLSQEGLQAGVRSFAALPQHRNAGRSTDKPRLYGLTKRNRVVYLDTDTDAGRSPFIILHEISHAAHYGGACGGHHSIWAKDFTARAARFQTQFPKARWLDQRPQDMARALARQYGVGTKCP